MSKISDKHCVFCGRTAASGVQITQEHVLPKWLSSQATVRFEKGKEAWRRSGRLIEPTRAMQPFTRRPRIACSDCNTGWMHRLEDRAMPLLKPLLDGFPAKLDFVGQAEVATWAAKTCFAMQYARHDIEKVVPEAHVRALAANRGAEPPADVHVFMGHVARPELDGDGRYHLVAYSARQNVLYENEQPRDDLAAYAITLRINRLVLQTQGLIESSPEAPAEWGHLYDERCMQRIWPRKHSSITWPPMQAVDDHPGGFNLLASRPDEWES